MASRKTPKMKNMIQVNSSNRKSLEKKYGFEIPAEVEFILPPDALQELLGDPESWEEGKQ